MKSRCPWDERNRTFFVFVQWRIVIFIIIIYYYYSHIFPESWVQHYNDATLLAGTYYFIPLAE